MFDHQQISKALDDFEAHAGFVGGAGPRALALPAPADVCGAWHRIRGPVDGVTKGLRAAAGVVPAAGRVAGVLEALATLLDALCP